MEKSKTKNSSSLLSDFHFLFNNQISALTRFKTIFTVAYFVLDNRNEIYTRYGEKALSEFSERVMEFLMEQMRETDFLFQMEEAGEYIFLFSFSGEKEVTAFFNRVEKQIKPIELKYNDEAIEVFPHLKVCLLEIKNNQATSDEVLNIAKNEVAKMQTVERITINVNNTFNHFNTETIKLSIIDSEPISIDILKNLFTNLELDRFQMEMASFQDGVTFLESKWHLSSHTHFIFINDILPKKEGLEIVHELRQLPQTSKYIIFMMSARNTEEIMNYAFDRGVDEYITIPYNLKMIEAKVKRYLKRLR